MSTGNVKKLPVLIFWLFKREFIKFFEYQSTKIL